MSRRSGREAAPCESLPSKDHASVGDPGWPSSLATTLDSLNSTARGLQLAFYSRWLAGVENGASPRLWRPSRDPTRSGQPFCRLSLPLCPLVEHRERPERNLYTESGLPHSEARTFAARTWGIRQTALRFLLGVGDPMSTAWTANEGADKAQKRTSNTMDRVGLVVLSQRSDVQPRRKCLDIGCGAHKRASCIGMDRLAFPGVDVVRDLEVFPWPFDDNEFDSVYASHVLEHLPNLVRTMEEVHRILKPGGAFIVRVPYYRYEGAFRDPTHVRFFTQHTFDYFTPDGATPLSSMNYYSAAHFTIQSQEFGWSGRTSWHVDRHIRNPALRHLAHRLLLQRRQELRVVLVPVKGL